jgi:hypothetical protein
MKTLSPKPGKIQQPSTVEDPIRAAFRLLPAAILVAGLGPEDREVLAYFVIAPVEDATKEPAAPLSPARRRVGDTSAVWSVGHPPTHGCVDCYISFWARWNRSPERNRILDALLAFEGHVAGAPATSPSSSRGRGRRGRVPTAPPPMPLRHPSRSSKRFRCPPPSSRPKHPRRRIWSFRNRARRPNAGRWRRSLARRRGSAGGRT